MELELKGNPGNFCEAVTAAFEIRNNRITRYEQVNFSSS